MSTKKENINDNIKKLESLINHFEKEDKQLNLEEDVSKYEEAMKIVATVKEELEGYELKINEIKAKYESDQEDMNF